MPERVDFFYKCVWYLLVWRKRMRSWHMSVNFVVITEARCILDCSLGGLFLENRINAAEHPLQIAQTMPTVFFSEMKNLRFNKQVHIFLGTFDTDERTSTTPSKCWKTFFQSIILHLHMKQNFGFSRTPAVAISSRV